MERRGLLLKDGVKPRQGQDSGEQEEKEEVEVSLWTDQEVPPGEIRTYGELRGELESLTQANRRACSSRAVYFYSCDSRAAYLLSKCFLGTKPMGVRALGESQRSRWASGSQQACCLWLRAPSWKWMSCERAPAGSA